MTLDDFKKLPDHAFPQVVDVEGAYGRLFGMTLRDYFAAKALQGMLVGDNAPGFTAAADMAYSYADAMMQAREAKEAPPAPTAQSQE